jgi:hypothetical protein
MSSSKGKACVSDRPSDLLYNSRTHSRTRSRTHSRTRFTWRCRTTGDQSPAQQGDHVLAGGAVWVTTHFHFLHSSSHWHLVNVSQ